MSREENVRKDVRKEATIVSYRTRTGKETEYTGTVEELATTFGYTLKCGKSYENERGNKKINMNPKTHKSLVVQLNNAAHNRAANGMPAHSYRLK